MAIGHALGTFLRRAPRSPAMLSSITAPYFIRCASARDALDKVAFMRRYNTQGREGKSRDNLFSDVCMVRASPAPAGRASGRAAGRAARRARTLGPLRAPRALTHTLAPRAALQISVFGSSNGRQAFVDLPEIGCGWVTVPCKSSSDATTSEPLPPWLLGYGDIAVVLAFRWIVPNTGDFPVDHYIRVVTRTLGGAMSMCTYLPFERLSEAGDDLLADASALEALAAKPGRQGLRSRANWAHCFLNKPLQV